MKKYLKIFIIIALLLFNGSIMIYAEDTQIEKIEVTDIQISEHKDTLEVGETMTLSVNVFPINADDNSVSYRSSDTSIATVSQNGEIKGVKAGTVKIFVSSGKVEKEIELNVKISAQGISINNDCLILKVKQSYQISPTVFPENATYKDIFYTSSDENVVTVSSDGVITAVGCGSAYIILKTADTISSMSVVVNEDFVLDENIHIDSEQKTQFDIPSQVLSEDYPVISSGVLEFLYNSKHTLKIVGKGYSLNICGEEIKNINNEIKTDIELQQNNENLIFVINEGKNLCGNLTLSLEDAERYKYLYLYDESQEKYRLIEYDDINNLSLSSSGKYMLTNSKVTYFNLPIFAIVISSAIVIIIGGIYVVLKRKYWFW